MSKCKHVILLLAIIFTVFALAAGSLPEAAAEQAGTFSGTWVASGKLQPFDFTEGRDVNTFKLAGHVNLGDAVGKAQDYWAECVGLSDSAAGSSARCVWRSLKGDKAYSVLRGEPLEEGQRVSGEFVGGTGRLKEITGTFTFTWISTFTDKSQNTFTGHTKDLKGSYRVP
jgi:hypothetical protein